MKNGDHMIIQWSIGDLVTMGNSDGSPGLTFCAAERGNYRINPYYGRLIQVVWREVAQADRVLHGLFKWGSLTSGAIWLYALVWSLL